MNTWEADHTCCFLHMDYLHQGKQEKIQDLFLNKAPAAVVLLDNCTKILLGLKKKAKIMFSASSYILNFIFTWIPFC